MSSKKQYNDALKRAKRSISDLTEANERLIFELLKSRRKTAKLQERLSQMLEPSRMQKAIRKVLNRIKCKI